MKNVNKNEQILKEIKECTFKPKLNVNRSDINSSKLVSLKQYSKFNSEIKKNSENKHELTNTQEKEISVCTFAPKIISDKKYKSSQCPKGFEKSVSRLQKKSGIKLKLMNKTEKSLTNDYFKSPKNEVFLSKTIKVDVNINLNESYKQKSYNSSRKK